ncbi:MAG: hypothetical protein Q4D57_06710 [Clostridia bacterium]|nr:hypothetical protein [Clostridia bacterium]
MKFSKKSLSVFLSALILGFSSPINVGAIKNDSKVVSGKQAEHKVSEIFEKEPDQWGLRGDPLLWKLLKKEFSWQQLLVNEKRMVPQISTSQDNRSINIKVENVEKSTLFIVNLDPEMGQTFNNKYDSDVMNITLSPKNFERFLKDKICNICGISYEDFSKLDNVYVEKCDDGSGMSSGWVSLDWWKETGIPLLKERYKDYFESL